MAIDRALWKKAIVGAYAPSWPCPSCAHGKMRVQRETFHREETAESRRRRSDDDFNDLDAEFVFAAILECTKCKEKVSCCGTGGYEPEQVHGPDGEITLEYTPISFAKYFSHSMPIFVPSKTVPGTVASHLYRSFLVFFCDISAAANHVRKCLEEILARAGISAKNEREEFVSLGHRIDLFKSRDAENADRASALRWIGNFGSHPESLTKDDVFDAYDILEVLLEDLYVGHHRSVRERVEQINKAKKPGRTV